MAQAAAAPPTDDLVPVQLALNVTKEGAVHEWVLWPPAASEADLSDFTDSLVCDLGLQPQLKHPIAEAIVAQVTDWCNGVPPLARGPAPRRELIRLDLVLDGSLRLRDQFWWDLHSDALTPEEFAAELCADSGVEARHGAAVAAAIRIELAKLRQAPPSNLPLPTPRIVEGKPAANGHQDAPLQSVYASSCTRAPEQWAEWGPSLHHMSLEEAQALQKQQQAAAQAQQAAAAQAHQQAAAQAQQAADAQRLQAQQRVAELERMQAAAAQQQAGRQAPLEQVPQQVPQLVPQQAVGSIGPPGRTTVVVPSLPLNPLAGQRAEQQLAMPQPVGMQQQPQPLLQQHALPTVQQQAAMQQHPAAVQAVRQPPGLQQQVAQQQQQQQQQEQQQKGEQQKGKKRGRGEAGAAAEGRRQLRPRRATRLAAILREEEEEDSESEEGGHSRDVSRRESGPAAAGARGHQATHSAGSGDYQPDADALAAAEEAERAAWDRKVPKAKAQAKAPRRTSGGAAAAAAPAAAAARASGPSPGLPGAQPVSVALRRQPVGLGPGLAAFQQHPPPGMAPPAAQQPALLHMQGPGGLPPPMPSLGVMGSTSGPGMGGGLGGPGIVPTIMLPGQASLGSGPVPMPLVPTAMGPTLEPTASAGVAQQLQLVAAAIVHYARELGIGEPKIQSFLACPPDEQLKLYRTLHQLVLQARSRQQQQLQAAVLVQQQQQQQQQQLAPAMPPAMPPGLSMGPVPPMGGAAPAVPPMGPPMGPPMPVALPPMGPPMQLDAMPMSAGPAGAGQYANLFSEMFD